jgi:hypothetical protein
MKILTALRDGIGRVNRAPAVLVGVLLATFLIALPLGLTLRGMIAQHLGASPAAERAANGVNYEWWREFQDQAAGVGTTFTPTILGFGAILDNVSAVLDNRSHAAAVAGAGAAYVLFWIFIVGGILDRYARNRPIRSHGFFSASGVFFFRFLRLAVFAWIGYGVLFGYVHSGLFRWLYPWVTRDFTVERNAFAVRVLLYLVFGLLLLATNMLFDYAKIRAVVEDRRSMIGALVAGGRFIARHPAGTSVLYLSNGALFVLVLAIYAAVVPRAGGLGWPMWLGLAIGQLYLLARLWVKLVFYASQTSFFQSQLAHAEYTAAPQPVWPESPAAEAIGPTSTA